LDRKNRRDRDKMKNETEEEKTTKRRGRDRARSAVCLDTDELLQKKLCQSCRFNQMSAKISVSRLSL